MIAQPLQTTLVELQAVSSNLSVTVTPSVTATPIEINPVGVAAVPASITTRLDALESKEVPVGGAEGEVLIKNSATNHDMLWSTLNDFELQFENNLL